MLEQALVIKLDRGFPLVRTAAGDVFRCKHATSLVKGEDVRAVIGDNVMVEVDQDADIAQISQILPRRCTLVRKDPAERALPQTLAANFDLVIVAHPLGELNMGRLQRELVLAFETGARVAIVLTKADLASEAEAAENEQLVSRIAGKDTRVLVVSDQDAESVEEVRGMIAPGTVAVLIGRSGVGKSSLVNLLAGENVQETTPVREVDGKGRHTTVSREMVPVPQGGVIVDMPGVRGLGMWESDEGIAAAFADVVSLAATCKFRDCTHASEPGCSVRAAIEAGELSQERLDAYTALVDENEHQKQAREQADRIRTRTGHPRRRKG